MIPHNSGAKRQVNLYVIGLCALALLVYWRWFLPGLISDQDWWNFTRVGLKELFPFPSTFDFSNNIGQSVTAYINYFPISSMIGALGQLGLSATAAERILVMFPTVLFLGVGGFYLARQYVTDLPACAIAGLFYGYNAYIDTVMARGQMTIAGSYACVPFLIALTVRAIRTPANAAYPLLMSVVFAVAVICDVRIAIVGAITAAAFAVFEFFRSESRPRAALNVALFMIAAVGLLAFIWVPVVAGHVRERPPLDFTDPAWLPKLSSASFWDLITAYKPLWFDGAIHPMPLWFFLNPLVLVIGFVAAWRRSRLWSIFLLALLASGSVLAAGVNTPFGRAYTWLFTHTWLMSMYRDPSKFYLLAMLPYALFFASAAEYLRRIKSIELVSGAVLALLAVGPSLPVLFTFEHQLYDPHPASATEAALSRIIAEDPHYGRVLWASTPDRQVPGDYRHPQMDGVWFASIKVGRRSVASDATTLRQALRVFGVRYIIIRKDSGEGLDYAPNFVARRTIVLYAQLGAFGKPIVAGDGLVGYSLPNEISAIPESIAAQYRIGKFYIPEQGSTDTAVPMNRWSIELLGNTIRVGNSAMTLPESIIPQAHGTNISLIPLSNAHGTVAAPSPSIKLEGALRYRIIPGRPFNGGIEIVKPNWTTFLDVRLRVPRRAKTAVISIADPNNEVDSRNYPISTLAECSTSCWVLIPVMDMPNRLKMSIAANSGSAHVITVQPVDEEIYNILSPSAVLAVRPTASIALAVPVAAAVDAAKPSGEMPISGITPTPADARFCLPNDGLRYAIAFANSELLKLRRQDGRIVDFVNRGVIEALPVVIGSGCMSMYSFVDSPLRLGWKVSVVTLAVVLAFLVFVAFPHFNRRTARAGQSEHEYVGTI